MTIPIGDRYLTHVEWATGGAVTEDQPDLELHPWPFGWWLTVYGVADMRALAGLKRVTTGLPGVTWAAGANWFTKLGAP